MTQDVDITLLTGFGGEPRYIDEILEHFRSRLSEARDFALKRRVLLLTADDGTDIDLALGALPFEERVVHRASDFEFYPGLVLRTCSAEDLIVLKAFAARERDWADVKGIIARQGSALNWPVIMAELEPLCEVKGVPEILKKLARLREQVP